MNSSIHIASIFRVLAVVISACFFTVSLAPAHSVGTDFQFAETVEVEISDEKPQTKDVISQSRADIPVQASEWSSYRDHSSALANSCSFLGYSFSAHAPPTTVL